MSTNSYPSSKKVTVEYQEKQLTATKHKISFPTKQYDKIKLGIIGLGHMGTYHASACTLIPEIELIGVADPNKEALKKIITPSVVATTHFQDWLHLVDAVIIAVPTDLHYVITKACLLQNKHVLLEKPITKTLSEAQELFEIAKKQNCALHIGHIERFNGAVQELKKIIHQPYLIESQRIGPFTSRIQKDSVILDLMIHDLDIILGLINAPVESVNTMGQSVKTKYCDIATVQIRFANGVLANIVSSRTSQIKRRTMSIHQQQAFIQLDFTTQDIFIHRHTSDSVKIGHNQLKYTQESMVERLFVYKENPLKLEIEHFIKAVKNSNKLIAPEKDLEALRLTLEIEKLLQG